MIVGPEGDAAAAASPTGARQTKLVQLVDRSGGVLLEPFAIPSFLNMPGLIVAVGRTFSLTDVGTDGVTLYRETFSYVVPDPGQPPTSLSSELTELGELRTFKREILDPLLQPTKHGTILTVVVDKLFGANASANAGAIARQSAAGLTR